MSGNPKAAATVALARRLEHWARSCGSPKAASLVTDATDLYRAATVYIEAIDRLVSRPDASREDQAKTLVEIQTWLYEEFQGHLSSMKAPLEATIDDLYG